MAEAVRSTCPYCGVGCGVLLTPRGDGGLDVAGDPDHPANLGRLCSKGASLGRTAGHEGRLTHPTIGGRRASWDDALDLVAERLRAPPERVALYLSGQLTTEDYYVANKLAKGGLGTANVDTNSRLCMASTVAGHRRAFGSDTVPGTYEDLETADLVVLVGSNLAWCHPVLHRRLTEARARRGTRVVVVDPRRTATCEGADLHLAVAPGTDATLFAALLAHLDRTGRIDRAWCAGHVAGLDAALAAARAHDPAACDLDPADLARFLDLWAGTARVVTVFSQGVNQSDHGTDTVNAILNCHLATGRIGREGTGPLSVTGQPNAMGGREVGGLANTLACHLSLEDEAHRAAVGAFWGSDRVPAAPGLKAVEMFDACADGAVDALWIACTNPLVSLPDAGRVAEGLRGTFVVVSEAFADADTLAVADVVLPSAAWPERDGTVTNSDRTISRQRPAAAPPGEARPDWWQFAQVGRRLGLAGFDWPDAEAVFREHAVLSGVAGRLGSDFDVSGLAGADWDAMAPVRWPVGPARRGGRFFGDGRFHHPDGRARMVAVAQPVVPAGPRLNTGRVRDQWHTMTRTSRAAVLGRHVGEPFLELHPEDAAARGIAPAEIVEVAGAGRTALLRALVTDRVRPGHPFAPIHWTAATAPAGRVDRVVAVGRDPLSGQPDLKGARVTLRRWPALWHGFAVCVRRPDPAVAYWARARCEGGWRIEMASDAAPDWDALRAALGLAHAAEVVDGARRSFAARDAEGRLTAALWVDAGPVAVARDHAAGLLGTTGEALSGRPAADRPDPGPTLCACLGVGRHDVARAVAGGCATVEAVGAATGAGTNCGACRPEIAALIPRLPIAAE